MIVSKLQKIEKMRDYNTLRAVNLLKKRTVKRGEVIMKCEPFAYAVSSTNVGNYCDNCLANYE